MSCLCLQAATAGVLLSPSPSTHQASQSLQEPSAKLLQRAKELAENKIFQELVVRVIKFGV